MGIHLSIILSLINTLHVAWLCDAAAHVAPGLAGGREPGAVPEAEFGYGRYMS